MPMVDRFIHELEQESRSTRRVLERVPEDKLEWRPNPKSSSLGQLALHIAMIPSFMANMASVDVFDVPAPRGQRAPASGREILEHHDIGLLDVPLPPVYGPTADEKL